VSSVPPPKFLSPATWISILPAFVAITVIVVMGAVTHASIAALGCGLLTIFGLAPMIGLIEAAKAESARGASGSHFIPRLLFLGGTFICCLLGTWVIAFAAGFGPSPLLWILVQTFGIAPATITAAILTGHSHRLPIGP
jgi:hypothetical protein